jgi:radical SAM superfamily enzyme YgiQ (UPF0313 family)/intein/homing endonuclease
MTEQQTIIPSGRLAGKRVLHDFASASATIARPWVAPTVPVLLITPPSVFLLDERVFMSLGILKVAAVLESAGVAVELLDLSGIENFLDVVEEHVRRTSAEVAAITTTTPQLPAAVKIAERIRAARPDMRVVLGGPHVTLVHSAVKMEKKAGRVARGHTALAKLERLFDVLVSGDGETAIFQAISEGAPKLIDADDPAGGMFMTNAVYDASPYPARHLVDVGSYNYTIEGHRAIHIIAQLGCPFACNFSVTGDALVFTDKGFQRMDSLVHGEAVAERCVHGGAVHVHKLGIRVPTADGFAIAESVVSEGVRPVFEVKAENGLSVKGTAEHPFMVVENGEPAWREIRDLKVGDWLVVRTPEREWPTDYVKLAAPVLPTIPPGGFKRRTEKTPPMLTEDVAWLVGFIIGDGCLPADGRPAVHICVTPSIREKLSRIVEESFGRPLSVNRAQNTSKMHHGWLHGRAAYDFFVHTMGISPANKLHVPPAIAQSKQSVIQAFLDGLYDADGYVDKRQKHGYLTTVSPDLAREVAALWLMLGKSPSARATKGYGEMKYGGTGDHFRVGTLHNDRIPTERAIYFSKKGNRWLWRTPRQPKNFLGVRKRTLVESGLEHPLHRDGWHYVRVTSITPCLPEPVYDLRVPGEHCFIANGFVVHNCGGRNSKSLRKTRMRSSESVIEEIEMLHRKYGFTGINLFDDELNVNPKMVELMNGIGDLQERLGVEFRLRGFVKSELFTDEQAVAMRRAGFRWILCGFEAAHPRILENINKKATVEDNTRVIEIANRHDLKVKALMSVGHAGESEETIRAVHDWLLAVQPADFDATVITTYPGTPYYDEAVPHPDLEDVWTFTCKKSGDRLHSYDVDYTQVADYYKGDPDGAGYCSYVFTDHLSGKEIVTLRDWVEREVRAKLNIPFNAGKAAVRYEHSMGQGVNTLPEFVLRTSNGAQPSAPMASSSGPARTRR